MKIENNQTKKEMVLKKLCEMGKAGIDVHYPKVFQILEDTNVEIKYPQMSISEIADELVNLAGVIS